MKRKNTKLSLCIFSGNRADYGPLEPVIREALDRDDISLSLLINKAHAPSNLQKQCQIYELDLSLNGTTAQHAIQQSALTLKQVGEHLGNVQPDGIIILGDRFEALAAAQAAVLSHIPIAHICGGDQSLGSFDEYFRHAITKLSQLHFVTHHKAAQRVVQMGEDPKMVHIVGHPGISNALEENPYSKKELFQGLHLNEDKTTIMMCFHSVTAHVDFGDSEFNEVLIALEQIIQWPSVQIIATAANPDPFGATINKKLRNLDKLQCNFTFHHTLGKDKFFSMMHYCELFMGNSSAIIYEAPVMGLHTMNIGARQDGRERPDTVLSVPAERTAIEEMVAQLLACPKPNADFSFGDGTSAKQICDILTQQQPV